MKRFTCLIAVLIALVCSNAFAAQYTSIELLGSTNVIEQTGISNYTSFAGLTKFEDAALNIQFKASGAGVSNVVFVFARSVDGSTKETVAPLAIAIPGNGTTLVNYITNFPNTYIGSAGYLHLSTITNNFQGAYITNISVKVYTKPKRFGN